LRVLPEAGGPPSCLRRRDLRLVKAQLRIFAQRLLHQRLDAQLIRHLRADCAFPRETQSRNQNHSPTKHQFHKEIQTHKKWIRKNSRTARLCAGGTNERKPPRAGTIRNEVKDREWESPAGNTIAMFAAVMPVRRQKSEEERLSRRARRSGLGL